MSTIIKKWFVFDGKQQTGPYSLEEMQDKVVHGKISPEQFVWCEGMDGWKALGEVDVLRGGSMTRRPPTPPPDFALPAVDPTGKIRKKTAQFDVEEHTFVKEIGKIADADRTGSIQRDVINNAVREAKAASHKEFKARGEIEGGTSILQNKFVWILLGLVVTAVIWFVFLKKGATP